MLGSRLRRLREAAGIGRVAAGDAIRASDSKISRMELGRVAFKQRDVADLLSLYGVGAQEHAEFMALVRQANSPGWWRKYSDILPEWFEQYVALEEAAQLIRTYEVQVIPGLLQTADYARALTSLRMPGASIEEIERAVSLGMRRQKLLTADNAPVLWVVLDEAALRRPLGGRAVMRAQVEHLIKCTELPNISIQIVPFDRGGHGAVGGPFTILRFAEPDLPDLVYLEQLSSALYLDKRDEVDGYMAVMDQLCVDATTQPATLSFLRDLIKELS